jgi:hypothetical protein
MKDEDHHMQNETRRRLAMFQYSHPKQNMNDGFRSISTRTVDSCRNGDLGMAFVMGFMQRRFVASGHG